MILTKNAEAAGWSPVLWSCPQSQGSPSGWISASLSAEAPPRPPPAICPGETHRKQSCGSCGLWGSRHPDNVQIVAAAEPRVRGDFSSASLTLSSLLICLIRRLAATRVPGGAKLPPKVGPGPGRTGAAGRVLSLSTHATGLLTPLLQGPPRCPTPPRLPHHPHCSRPLGNRNRQVFRLLPAKEWVTLSPDSEHFLATNTAELSWRI